MGLEQILTYPHPNVKLLNGVLPANASYLHRDAQGSVRQITSAAGVSDQRRFYLPYGAVSLSTVAVTNPAPDTKGWIGERFDADAGLQYLNARYYDPQLGMFLQPDWWEVMQAGVGTNRYSYSFGDPVNGIDPTGHEVNKAQATNSKGILETLRNFFTGLGKKPNIDDMRYTEKDTGGGKQVGPFGGVSGPRYVNTKKYGWLDMGHLGQAAAVGKKEIEGSLGGMGQYLGYIGYWGARDALWDATVAKEEEQGVASKWSFEDGPSNLAGLDFYWDYYDTDETLLDDLGRFLDDAGAMNPNQSEIWDRIPDHSQDARVFEDNKSLVPMHNPGPFSGQQSSDLAPSVSLRPPARAVP